MKWLVSILWIALALNLHAQTNKIMLRNGTSLNGRITSAQPAKVQIEVSGSTLTLNVEELADQEILRLPKEVSGLYKEIIRVTDLCNKYIPELKTYHSNEIAKLTEIIEKQSIMLSNQWVELEALQGPKKNKLAPGSSKGDIEVLESSFKVMSESGGYVDGAWLVKIHNNTALPMSGTLVLEFYDKEGFKVNSDSMRGVNIPAAETKTFSDKIFYSKRDLDSIVRTTVGIR
jgi:hypothetical protein